ncbi:MULTISPECIES: bifunctional lysylphosphatidylglycerol flippase/synthetase MprF [unclassified Nocardia]|uniref:bifunctional lysylphosphatidylglycerol flippase/synthetase MprF n=1 Tax=unclassified Nocardia TaxID=2637762 RepID=UPI001CE3C695|nr:MULTISPECIES: DUF2156 domain-containing protein [unclassified Nocardia]
MARPIDTGNRRVNEQGDWPRTADGVAPAHVLERFSDNPSAFLALNVENELFTASGIDGFICYRGIGRSWIQFGGAFADRDQQRELLERFRFSAKKARRRLLAVQLQHADAQVYTEAGWSVNQLGASYAVELEQMKLRGKKFVRLRNKISRARRAGLQVSEVSADEHADAIATIDRSWLSGKGSHVKELEFLVGEIGGPYQPLRRFFLGTIDDRPIGYISYSPVYGQRPGWLHDLTRRVSDAPPGVMETINVDACQKFKKDGATWLHFGFTPFTGLNEEHEMPSARRSMSLFVHGLAKYGDKIYPARSQLDYKLKWEPTVILPEYIAFPGRPSLRSVVNLFRVTNSI